MSNTHRRAPSRYWLAFVIGAVFASGCGQQSALENAGIAGLKPSDSWRSVETSRFLVPGRSLAAWSSPDGSSFVVARALAVPRGTAEGLLREYMVRVENLPELRILEDSKRKVAGIESAYLEIVAPGTGDTLAPTGLGKPIGPEGKTLVPTRRIVIGIPGPTQTIWLIWHSPESSASALKADVESTIKNMTIRDQASTSY